MNRSSAGLLLTLMLVVGCADVAGRPPPATLTELPAVVAALLGDRRAPATDLFEVWVCAVPPDTQDPLYAPTRWPLTPEGVVERISAGVTEYWQTVSHLGYRPAFTVGGSVSIRPTETSQQCVDLARAGAGPLADAVLVVADAEHAADQPGGRSSPGTWLTCPGRCAAGETGRFVYVGSNDFAGAGSAEPPLDLIEHEIGHSLGLPHSGDTIGRPAHAGTGPYDVMGDPAAPRHSDPTRRDAPGMIAIGRLDLGWLPAAAAHLATGGGEVVELQPSAEPGGTRVMIVPIDEHRVLTAELLIDHGYHDHLPRHGVVVHLVDDTPARCGTSTPRCTHLLRAQLIVPADRSGRTLLVAGDRVSFAGWTLTVDAIDSGPQPVTHLRAWRAGTNRG